LEKLQLAVDKFIKAYQNSVPELKLLSISVPDGQITNVTVAQETVCLVKKLRKIMPNKLGNFVSIIICPAVILLSSYPHAAVITHANFMVAPPTQASAVMENALKSSIYLKITSNIFLDL
jgi:hypothetical protein